MCKRRGIEENRMGKERHSAGYSVLGRVDPDNLLLRDIYFTVLLYTCNLWQATLAGSNTFNQGEVYTLEIMIMTLIQYVFSATSDVVIMTWLGLAKVVFDGCVAQRSLRDPGETSSGFTPFKSPSSSESVSRTF